MPRTTRLASGSAEFQIQTRPPPNLMPPLSASVCSCLKLFQLDCDFFLLSVLCLPLGPPARANYSAPHVPTSCSSLRTSTCHFPLRTQKRDVGGGPPHSPHGRNGTRPFRDGQLIQPALCGPDEVLNRCLWDKERTAYLRRGEGALHHGRRNRNGRATLESSSAVSLKVKPSLTL